MSFQTNTVCPADRPLAQLTARFGVGLAAISAILALLALVASRALPDGGAIGFLLFRDGNTDLYVLDIARGTLHNLTDNGAVNGSFAFSPDGTRFAFESNKDGNTEIYMMNVKCPGLFDSCGGIRQLTDNTTDSRYPVWSPDGRQLAYVFDVSWEDANDEVYVMDIESGETRNLTNHPAGDQFPAWSPDGRQIAFVSYRDSPPDTNINTEIYVVNTDGSNLQRLTEKAGADINPIWSPDGSWIAFQSLSPPDYISEVDVISANGSQFEKIMSYSVLGVMGNQSAWLPNSRQLIALSVDGENADVAVIDIETHGIIQLTHNDVTSRGIGLSPDGHWVVFDSFDYTSGFGIYIADTTGNSPPRLIYAGGSLPAWWP